VRLTTPAGQVTAKLIGGTYPAWQRVIPAWNPEMTAVIRREHAKRMLARFAAIGPAGRDELRALRFDQQADGFEVSAARTGEIAVSDHLAADGCGSWPTFGLQGRYLAAVVAQTSGDISVSMTDDSSPVAFRDAADPRAQFVIMPMRV
jgi:DNA polymerase III sliding clamp (beta) subunit (PCNA family)